MRIFVILLATVGATTASAVETYFVDPSVGNNTFTAIFESEVGERITANSSQVQCDLSFDDKSGLVSGKCAVPLMTIDVDMNETKRAHFQQWATNKKSKAEACRFEVELKYVKTAEPLQAGKPVPFTTEAPFTICGKKRTDGAKEKITGTVRLSEVKDGPKRVRIRANIAAFHRDQYLIGPKFTDGWLARVEQLGPVVSEVGTIDFTLFAKQTTAVAK